MTLRMRLSMGFALLLTVIASVVALPTGQASAQVQPVADIAFGAGVSNYRNDGDVRIRAGITNNGPDAARVMLTVTIPAGLDVWPDTVRSVADEAKDCNDPGNGEDLVCEFVAAIPAEGFLSTHWGMDPTPAEGPQATFPITGVSITVTPLDGVVDPDLCNNTWDAAGWLQPGDLTAWTQDCDGDGSVNFLNSMDDRIRQEQIDAIVTTNGFDPVETNPCIPTPYATQADFDAAVAANPLVSVTDCEGNPAESNLGVSVVGPGELTEGSNVVTLTVTNNGPDESGSYTATFTVPSGGTINPATLPTGCTADNQVVSCSTAVPIPSGSQASFPIEVIVEPGNHGTVLGPFEGTVEGTSTTHVDLDPSDNETSESFPVEPGGSDLVTTVSGGPLIPGQTNNLVITVTNQGPDTSGNYTTTYTIPTGGTVDPTALPAECTIDDQEITCSGGPLGNGGSNTFTIPVFIPNSFGGGTFGPNTVTTTINTGGPTIDPTPTNNTHSTTIAVDDGDGIPASVENSLRDGDGNRDGRPDSQQSNVATFSSPISGDAVTFTTSGANCSAIRQIGLSEESVSSPDPNYDYPVGLFDFRIVCDQVGAEATITIILDDEYNTAVWAWRKFNAADGTYEDFTTQPTYGTTIVNGDTVTTVSFSLRDGGENDEDGIANAVIIDPSGPGVLTFNSVPAALAFTGAESAELLYGGALALVTGIALWFGGRGLGQRNRRKDEVL